MPTRSPAQNTFLPVHYRIGTADSVIGRAIDEQLRYLASGIDGFFTDQADISVIARAEFVAAKSGRLIAAPTRAVPGDPELTADRQRVFQPCVPPSPPTRGWAGSGTSEAV